MAAVLYTSYKCPYSQRAWIARNYKGLQEITLVPIDLVNRPTWYKEKVYPPNKIPSLEHNNEVRGGSLDLVKYIDSHFEGPSLLPKDPAKKEFSKELLSYSDTFIKTYTPPFIGDPTADVGVGFDYLETALLKYGDGPFFLGQQFSEVDVAYIPFVERLQLLLLAVRRYNITTNRPKLARWIEEVNKIEVYQQTKLDHNEQELLFFLVP